MYNQETCNIQFRQKLHMTLDEYLSATGISVAEFAAEAGLSEPAIYKIKSDMHRAPEKDTIEKIAKATHGKVTVFDLLKLDRENHKSKKSTVNSKTK